MTYEFDLPDAGEGMAEAEIVRWLVDEGEEVAENDPIVEIETDKATMDIDAPVAGVVTDILVAEGDVVAVGTPIVRFDGEGSDDSETTVRTETPQDDRDDATDQDTTLEQESAGGDSSVGTDDDDVVATPNTRRLARELGVSLSAVPPSRHEEDRPVVTEADLLSVLEVPDSVRIGGETESISTDTRDVDTDDSEDVDTEDSVENGSSGTATERGIQVEERIPYRGIRRQAGQHLKNSWFTAVHALGQYDFDVTELVELRNELKETARAEGVRLTYNPFILKACVAGLQEYPIVNSSLDEEANEIIRHGAYNIGVAVATERGLQVPVIDDVDEKSIYEIATEIDELIEKANANEIAREDLQGGTFTVTNTGVLGSKHGMPIINYPEAAIVSIGKIEQQPLVVDDEIQKRYVMPFDMSSDHRIVDGEEAVGFVNVVREYLENPTRLLME